MPCHNKNNYFTQVQNQGPLVGPNGELLMESGCKATLNTCTPKPIAEKSVEVPLYVKKAKKIPVYHEPRKVVKRIPVPQKSKFKVIEIKQPCKYREEISYEQVPCTYETKYEWVKVGTEKITNKLVQCPPEVNFTKDILGKKGQKFFNDNESSYSRYSDACSSN